MRSLKGSLTQKTQASLQAGCDVVCYCSGHEKNNALMLDECEEVLKACHPLSDKGLKRLEKVFRIVNKSYTVGDVKAQQKYYDTLVKKSKECAQKGVDHTENWFHERSKI